MFSFHVSSLNSSNTIYSSKTLLNNSLEELKLSINNELKTTDNNLIKSILEYISSKLNDKEPEKGLSLFIPSIFIDPNNSEFKKIILNAFSAESKSDDKYQIDSVKQAKCMSIIKKKYDDLMETQKRKNTQKDIDFHFNVLLYEALLEKSYYKENYQTVQGDMEYSLSLSKIELKRLWKNALRLVKFYETHKLSTRSSYYFEGALNGSLKDYQEFDINKMINLGNDETERLEIRGLFNVVKESSASDYMSAKTCICPSDSQHQRLHKLHEHNSDFKQVKSEFEIIKKQDLKKYKEAIKLEEDKITKEIEEINQRLQNVIKIKLHRSDLERKNKAAYMVIVKYIHDEQVKEEEEYLEQTEKYLNKCDDIMPLYYDNKNLSQVERQEVRLDIRTLNLGKKLKAYQKLEELINELTVDKGNETVVINKDKLSTRFSEFIVENYNNVLQTISKSLNQRYKEIQEKCPKILRPDIDFTFKEK